MPANVLQVTPKTWNKDGQNITTYWITLDDRTDDVPSYDERAKDLKSHEPLPDGWEVATSAKGKPYLKAPKQGGGKGGGFAQSWYNSEAGVRFTQERMDRRTALMQAVECYGISKSLDDIETRATDFYAWLRASDSAAPAASPSIGTGGRGTTADPIPPERPEAKDSQLDGEAGAVTPVEGGGAATSVGDGGAVLPPIKEPHTFEAGRQLTSGSYLCKVCGGLEREHG